MKTLMRRGWEDKIKGFVKRKGADVVGIAPVERFEKAPKGFNPRDVMSDAQSVIVIGKYFPIGVLNGKSRAAITRVYENLFGALDNCAYELSCFIEKRGGRALAIPADMPYLSWDAEKQHGRGDLSHKHAAVLAGLGQLGRNSLLMTPEFGNRVNLTSIVTNLPLKGDPLFKEVLCTGCNLCIRSCPAKAIRRGKVAQKQCRKFHMMTTPRGFKLFACWECRRVCPVHGKIGQENFLKKPGHGQKQ